MKRETLIKLSEEAPLIHCITNPISMMQCANAILGIGAKPIMAEHPMEVKEITDTAGALLLNFGNISDTRMEAMRISLRTALEKDIPVVIDAVGVSCSQLRRDFLLELLKIREDILGENADSRMLLIKGNYSEIVSIADEKYHGKGVDADASLDKEIVINSAVKISEKYEVMVLASGAIDIVIDKNRTFQVKNGHKKLGMITGTGCMLGAICAGFLSVSRDLETVADACTFLGICGENAAEKTKGSGSFLVGLLDEISLLN